ncbi:beta-galactosidase [Gracilibacillus sp. Marseille-QA3620]
MKKKLVHGAAYYPELWDVQAVEIDISYMKEVGINTVRMGEFAWSKIEPNEGEFDLSFFKDIIELLCSNGIETVMCTPTATPPIWVTHNHPERMHVNRAGKRMVHGSRQHICTNHPYFRERAARITEALASELSHLPSVIAWQLDNEFKCHVAECYCETCRYLWHQWLEEKYQTINALNEAWGTDIWSEYYHSFEQIPVPEAAPFLHNSSLHTNYQLFHTEKIAEFAQEQSEIIRRYSNRPITHNSTLFFSVDNEKLFADLDFASFDTYAPSDGYGNYLMNCDVWRNLKKGKDFWVMETSPSYPASLESCTVPHPEGYLKAEAVAAYALGGQAFCYWLWRQQKSGCEQPHSSILSAWGKPGIGYKNVIEVEKARKAIEPFMIHSNPKQAEVAVTYSDRGRIFMKTEPLNGLDYKNCLTDFYKVLLSMGIHRDLIPEDADFDGYKILFTPFLYHVSTSYINKAKAFAESGGIWIVGPMSGGRTENHTVHTDAGLGMLDDVAGVETLYSFPADSTHTYGRAYGETELLGKWGTVFKPLEAIAVGILSDGLAEQEAFITERAIGKGKIVLLGGMPKGEEQMLLKKLFLHYTEEASVRLCGNVTEGTIIAPRELNDKTFWTVINMDGKGGGVSLPEGGGVDLLTDETLNSGYLPIGKYEYRLIRLTEES